MDIELHFSALEMLACLIASIYMLAGKEKKIGFLFLLSFLLQFQSVLYIQLIEHLDGTGECWATAADYYSCLPTAFKISIHSAQVGIYTMAAAIVLCARKLKSLQSCT